MHSESNIIDSGQYDKILSYFPADKKNFAAINIYTGSRDGWGDSVFNSKVLDQGPVIILMKTKLDAICGGYTSKGFARLSSK